ncbi:rod shape-determining protein MreD [soil metagenome]
MSISINIIFYLFGYLGLVMFQVLVLNRLDLSFYINPYIYPFFVLMLPFRMPHWLLMILAFGAGLTLDAFSNTASIHAAALVFLAFVRPYWIGAITPKGGYETEERPNIRGLGFSWFALFTFGLIFLHHFFYFFLEVFSLTSVFSTLGKALMSSIVSTILIVLLAYLFSREKKRS